MSRFLCTRRLVAHRRHIDTLVREIHRVLRPGGHLVIREHNCDSNETALTLDLVHGLYALVWRDPPEDPTFLDEGGCVLPYHHLLIFSYELVLSCADYRLSHTKITQHTHTTRTRHESLPSHSRTLLLYSTLSTTRFRYHSAFRSKADWARYIEYNGFESLHHTHPKGIQQQYFQSFRKRGGAAVVSAVGVTEDRGDDAVGSGHRTAAASAALAQVSAGQSHDSAVESTHVGVEGQPSTTRHEHTHPIGMQRETVSPSQTVGAAASHAKGSAASADSSGGTHRETPSGRGGSQADASTAVPQETPWRVHQSKSTGKKYYFNKVTGESVYEPPPDLVAYERAQASALKRTADVGSENSSSISSRSSSARPLKHSLDDAEAGKAKRLKTDGDWGAR
jgi:hypothetical protein